MSHTRFSRNRVGDGTVMDALAASVKPCLVLAKLIIIHYQKVEYVVSKKYTYDIIDSYTLA